MVKLNIFLSIHILEINECLHLSNGYLKFILINMKQKRFQGFSNYDFIEVKYIDRCVGFMRIRDTFYIFDKENQVNYK